MVGRKGLEPSRREPIDPKSIVYTNFTTRPYRVAFYTTPFFMSTTRAVTALVRNANKKDKVSISASLAFTGFKWWTIEELNL